MRESAIDTTSALGKIRIHFMQQPDAWLRPADVATALDLDQKQVANYLARMSRKGDLERRQGEIRKGAPGPRTEYQLTSGRNLLAPRQKES